MWTARELLQRVAGTADTAQATGELDGVGVRDGEAGTGILISRPSRSCPAAEFSTVHSDGDFILRDLSIAPRFTAGIFITRLMRRTYAPGDRGSTTLLAHRTRMAFIRELGRSGEHSTLDRP